VSDGTDWTSGGRLLTVPEPWVSSSKRAIADSDTPRRADVEKTGGRRMQPASTSRRQISDVL